MIKAENIKKIYQTNGDRVLALKGISLNIEKRLNGCNNRGHPGREKVRCCTYLVV
jgi:hypothetical protein